MVASVSAGTPWLVALAALGAGMSLLAAAAWLGGLVWQLSLTRAVARGETETRAIVAAAAARFAALLGWLVALAALGGALALLAEALQTGQSPSAGLATLVFSNVAGRFWLLRLAAVLIGWLALVLWPARDVTTARRQWRELLALLGALLLIAALATTEPGAGGAWVDTIRLAAMALWLGGAWFGAWILLPILERRAPEDRAAALVACAPVTLALTCGSLLVAAVLTAVAWPWRSPAGDVSLVPALALVAQIAAALGVGLLAGWRFGALRRDLRRDLARAAALAPATANAPRQALRGKLAHTLRRDAGAHRFEASLAVVALIAVTLAGFTSAPSGAAVVASGAAITARRPIPGAGQATLSLSPARVGANTLELTLTDAAGNPLAAPARALAITATMLDMPMGTQTTVAPFDAARDAFVGPVDLVMLGDWRLAITFTPPGQSSPITVTLDISLRPSA